VTEIILSDTNIVLKIVLFKKLDLCTVEIPSYGKIKFDAIVQKEISRWIKKHDQGKKNRKVDRFTIDIIKLAFDKAREHQCLIAPISEGEKENIFGQYEAIVKKISSNSSSPSEEDFILLLNAERRGHYMLTGDDIMFKLGKKIIGKKSLELEDIFIQLVKGKLISKQDVRDFSDLLDSYGELFKITKVLSNI
jgi:hypothetical protein